MPTTAAVLIPLIVVTATAPVRILAPVPSTAISVPVSVSISVPFLSAAFAHTLAASVIVFTTHM
jgi:hypothetical protein